MYRSPLRATLPEERLHQERPAHTFCFYRVLVVLAAFFSRTASFFCLLDFRVAFCSFFCFCSLFAIEIHPAFQTACTHATTRKHHSPTPLESRSYGLLPPP